MRTIALILVVVAALLVPSSAAGGILSKQKKEKLWYWYRTSGAKCIKSHEGWWTANTGNGYFGGFQANYDFARGYGKHYRKNISYTRRWGMPSNWKPVYQIHMAKHGWRARGFQPWPNTRLMCGV